MPLTTSEKFASMAASGTDWRDTSKKILEQLESVKTGSETFNFGFLYVSDVLSDDLSSILTLFRSVTGIENWVGSIGLGICDIHADYFDVPAIAAMVCSFDDQSFNIFHSEDENFKDNILPFIKEEDPVFLVGHMDPFSEKEPEDILKEFSKTIGGFAVGGLTSSRHQNLQIANDAVSGGFSGVVFSSAIPVATALAQGCRPIGDVHTIDKAEEHIIKSMDGQKPLDLFSSDLKLMAYQKLGVNPDTIKISTDDMQNLPEDIQNIFKGEAHIAFLTQGSDQKDYIVRDIIGVDEENGWMAVSKNISVGDHVMFVHRNDKIMQSDLSKMLCDLRKRVEKDQGEFNPKGALFISCVARAGSEDDDGRFSEVKLIQDILGDIPLVGFYASGEISNDRLYGYTGVLTLFL